MNLILATVGFAAGCGVYHLYKKTGAINMAVEMSGEKGILNLGSGYHRNQFSTMVADLPEVVCNVDIIEFPEWETKYLTHDLEEPLPFEDNQFDVVFSSHILEHLGNWEAALDEWNRVGDNVVICIPNPLSITGWLHPGHKQHFNWSDVKYIETNWPRTTVII